MALLPKVYWASRRCGTPLKLDREHFVNAFALYRQYSQKKQIKQSFFNFFRPFKRNRRCPRSNAEEGTASQSPLTAGGFGLGFSIPLNVSSSGSETVPSDSYKYSPLKKRVMEIRLLILSPGAFDDEIFARLRHVSLDDQPTYDAISYTWGDLNNAAAIKLRQDGVDLQFRDFKVTKNVESALRHLRSTSVPKSIWIDSICINQADIIERNEQVKIMSSIYHKANTVRSWLGPSTEDSRLAMDFLRKLDRRFAWVIDWFAYHTRRRGRMESLGYYSSHISWIANAFQDPTFEKTWAAIRKFWQKEYWGRIWVVQELVFGTRGGGNVILHCGKDEVSWRAIERLDHALASIEKNMQSNDQADLDLVLRSDDARPDLCWFVNHVHRTGTKNLLLSQLLVAQRRCKSTDPRDKVYALLGVAYDALAPQPSSLKVDYGLTIAEVYRMSVEEVVKDEKKLDVICASGTRDSANNLPSWCPDWSMDSSKDGEPSPLWDPNEPRAYWAAGETEAVVQFLESGGIPVLVAEGWAIDEINVFPPNFDSKTQFLDTKSLQFLAGEDISILDESVWRTLVANQVWAGQRPPVVYDSMYATLISRLTSGPRSESIELQYAQRSDILTQELTAHVGSGKMPRVGEALNFTTPFRRWVSDWLYRRKLCKTTKRGFPGLVPDTARNGDLIIVLKGCDLPLTVRSVRDHYVLIGECYIHGIMNGEALLMESEGDVSLQHFRLH